MLFALDHHKLTAQSSVLLPVHLAAIPKGKHANTCNTLGGAYSNPFASIARTNARPFLPKDPTPSIINHLNIAFKVLLAGSVWADVTTCFRCRLAPNNKPLTYLVVYIYADIPEIFKEGIYVKKKVPALTKRGFFARKFKAAQQPIISGLFMHLNITGIAAFFNVGA